jgi:hypothetical protein
MPYLVATRMEEGGWRKEETGRKEEGEMHAC